MGFIDTFFLVKKGADVGLSYIVFILNIKYIMILILVFIFIHMNIITILSLFLPFGLVLFIGYLVYQDTHNQNARK